ncbi:hypothetical protein L3I75_000115 [Vibrio vulnificus]|nr:hypothetical protein [Vibrio vulnificus]EIU7861046.1 hypothetical protein [Vibrio vulnificus]EJE8577320.1 hypothetical protein [Vibrio vulnificus]EKA7348904.1 hypothetical protein [Vibrio vulnificus]MCU8217748.1 hypothetical protein [Vibrio vulnificus]
MGKKLEMLTILSAARTMKWEERTLKNGPTKEQLLGAIGLAQRDNPIGIAILSAKYMRCAYSIEKLYDHIKEQPLPLITRNQREHASYLLVSDALNLPIDVMQKRIIGAWKRYSMRGERTRKTIDSLKKSIKSLEKAILLKNSAQEIKHLESQIEAHKARINTEERLLHDYAMQKAGESCKCPRCRATGTIQKTQRQCDTCAGIGEFRTLEHDWLKSLIASDSAGAKALKDNWPSVVISMRAQKDVLRRHELDAVNAVERRISAEFEYED